MTYDDLPLDPDVAALLERGKVIKAVPDVVRARSLARARATITAAVRPHPESIPTLWRRALPVALAASIALAVGTAGAVVALRSRAPQGPGPASPLRPAAASPVSAATGGTSPTERAVVPPSLPAAKPQRSTHPHAPRESYAAELYLLQRGQVAYAGRDFSGALALVAEHRRQFPNGRLAEEREALRVRSLAGAGRTDEAARAAAAFADRFPRSVLLPRLGTAP